MVTFMYTRRIPRRPSPSSGRVKHVRLIDGSWNLRQYWGLVGIVEEFVGDDVLVRYGEVVIQVPAEWVVPAEEA